MNSTEFNRWWTDAKTCWPSLGAWLVKHFDNEISEREFLRKWAGVLADVQLADAIEVNRLMQSGDLPFVGEYEGDKERLPQHVRRLARKMSWERANDGNPEPAPELKPTSFPAGKILKRILALTDSGVPSAEAKQIVLAELPVGRPNYEPRYSCSLCLDVGRIFVASQAAVHAMAGEVFDACHHRTSVVLCKCREGMKRHPKSLLAVYSADLCFKVDDTCWPESQVERFREWCEAKREAYWNSKREPAFDAFNQREYAQ